MAAVHLPRLMRIGARASLQLPSALATLGSQRPLVVTDSFMKSSGTIDGALGALAQSKISYRLFDGVVPDPTTTSLDGALAMAADGACDAVVGIGGGSSLDTAKAVAILAVHGGPLRRFKVPSEAPKGLPVIAVPTTAGTGSEVTRFSIVTDSEMEEKMLVVGDGCLPDAALVDFELSMKKPYRLTADNGLDTLCHAMEAFVSQKANPFTDSLALAALQAVARHLRTACKTPSDRQAREGMMLAATQAGIAFSNSSVTLIHGMSRPIGAHFHIAHGLSNAILLPSVTAFSLRGAEARYAECSRALGFASADDSDARANEQLVAGLQSLCAELQVPGLRELGVDADTFVRMAPLMAEQALASGSPANNPVVPSAMEVQTLYHELVA